MSPVKNTSPLTWTPNSPNPSGQISLDYWRKPRNWLGASRGIVYATTRDPANSPELDAVAVKAGGRVVILQLDMLNAEQLKSAATALAARTSALETIIINAAIIAGKGPLPALSAEDLLANLQGNVVGPHNVIQTFSDFLLVSQAPKRALELISSFGGSITNAKAVGEWLKGSTGLEFIALSGYAISKSGLNMLGRQWAAVLEPKGVAVLAIHPGGVATRMTQGMSGTISTAESAKGVIDVYEKSEVY